MAKLHPTHYDFGAEIPPAAEVDLATLDVADPELWRRDLFWDRFERLRAEDPVHYCPDSFCGPYWSITRYDDIMAVDTNHKVFSSDVHNGGIVLYDADPQFPAGFITMDEPKHTAHRQTVQPIVGPDFLRKFEELIRVRTQTLLDTLPRGEAFDWVNTVSIELTTMMLATLFDFPFEDRRRLTRWSDVATGEHNEAICPGGREQWEREMLECLEVFTGLWNERINSPERRGDLVSMMAHHDNTRNMTPSEYFGNLILLIVGGNDTTRNSMTGGLYALSKNPDQYDKLRRDRSVIPNMVSEIIRWQTPLAHMRRTAIADCEVAGKTIRKGDRVAMWYVSGNRDDAIFENPNAFLVDRKNARQHMAFGFGIHRCVGNRLADLQLRILWEEIMQRFDRIEVLEEPERVPNPFVKGYSRMMVEIPAA
ncbi:MAG TPA: cytochrome P450 [Candidatus Limnocylindrales bacterium]|nr:cytochrome P450 [Candidatus Limnocylindrales bacterium]